MARGPRSVVRLVDVAARAGVSATVVSTVLRGGASNTVRVSPRTAELVKRIAKEMHYRPNVAAQQLKGRTSDVIGVLIGAASTAANYERLSAIEAEAYRRGYRLMIGHFHHDSDRVSEYVKDFISRGVQAMLCFHNPLPQHDLQLSLLLEQVPALVFQTEPIVPGACCVDVDRAAGVEEAVRHLVEGGRQRIGLVINSSDDPLMQDRIRGYRAGMRQAGRPVDPILIFAGNGTFPPPRALVEQAVQLIIDEVGADAVIASNDVWAIGLIKAMRRIGRRVPDDVAVIGFDNLPAASLFDPELTSIDQNNGEFARAALDLLAQSLEKGPLPADRRRIIVQPRLVVRQSS